MNDKESEPVIYDDIVVELTKPEAKVCKMILTSLRASAHNQQDFAKYLKGAFDASQDGDEDSEGGPVFFFGGIAPAGPPGDMPEGLEEMGQVESFDPPSDMFSEDDDEDEGEGEGDYIEGELVEGENPMQMFPSFIGDILNQLTDSMGDKSNVIMPVLVEKTLHISSVPAKNLSRFYYSIINTQMRVCCASIQFKKKVAYYKMLKTYQSLGRKVYKVLEPHFGEEEFDPDMPEFPFGED